MSEDLPDLTEKEFAFVNKLFDGKSASDAYRFAYNCEKSSPNTIWVNASRLKASTKVSLWLAQMTKDRVEVGHRTIEVRVARMERLALIAEQSGNIGAAVKAEELVGKLDGHYISLSQNVSSRKDDLALLKDIASDSTEGLALAMKEAKGLGLEKELKEALGTVH